MERVDTEGQIATAKTLAQLLSQIPLTAHGPAQIMIFDIHALQERFYFADTVIPRLETAIPLLKKHLAALPDVDKVSVAFPDDGAYKRFHTLFDDRPFIICNKVRDGDKRLVKVKEGTAKDRQVLIIDDLIQTGGTLIESAKALIAAGATSVSAYVTHAVFPNDSWHRFLPSSSPDVVFSKFYITDSIPHAAKIAQNPPFQLISLAPAIADILLAYDLSHY
jgi:phosphoribosylpyrophosphate synthetase